MFGHQDDQHHHHDDDNKPMDNVVSDAVADHVASDEHHEGTHAFVSGDAPVDISFNPALPVEPTAPPAPSDVSSGSPSDDGSFAAVPAARVSGDLLDIKQQALTSLSPLVDHLDQTPEEKFRTTMMMIQASDNKDLIKNAYEAANAIGDEKVKAQALLDIVNEINYFTQQSA